jgi:hypothetical protein
MKLALYVGIEVVFIAPSKPWMNGTIEEFNKGFDKRFWKKDRFRDLNDIRRKSPEFFEKENKFNAWKLRNKNLKEISPKRMLPDDFAINVNHLPMVAGKIHFIRVVDYEGRISVLDEYFDVGKEYIDEYVWATIETDNQVLIVRYKDEELMVREIKKFKYKINEVVHDREDSIFGTGL